MAVEMMMTETTTNRLIAFLVLPIASFATVSLAGFALTPSAYQQGFGGPANACFWGVMGVASSIVVAISNAATMKALRDGPLRRGQLILALLVATVLDAAIIGAGVFFIVQTSIPGYTGA